MRNEFMAQMEAAAKTRAEKIVELRRQGYKWRDIGDRFGITYQRASQIGTKAAPDLAGPGNNGSRIKRPTEPIPMDEE